MSEGIEELSVEELARIQRQHEEKLAAQRAAEEDERQRQAQIKAQTDADYARRPSVIAEARAAQSEVDKMEAEQIGEKIERTEDLQKSESAKEAELAAITRDLDQASARLQVVSGLVEGKNEDEISEPVRQALEAATLRESSIRSKKEALDKEIADLRADQVSDEQVRRYRGLVESVEGLAQQIDGIDANPAMREILEDEALGEDKLRNEAVQAAEGITYGSNHNETKKNLAAVIAQQFITEELEREGIQSIPNPEEQQMALAKFMEEITVGIRSWKEGDRADLLRWGNASPAKKAGVALGLMIDGISDSRGLYEGIQQFHGDDTSDFISAHLGSINFARGYDKGMTRHHRLLGDLSRPWEQFEQRAVARGGFQEVEDVILPADADEGTINLALEKYKKASESAKKDDTALTKIEEDRKAARIAVLDREIAELRQTEAVSKEMRQILDSYPQIVTHISEYTGQQTQQQATGEPNEIASMESKLGELSRQLEAQEALLEENQGWTKRGRRREINEKIAQIEYWKSVFEQSLGVSKKVAAAKEHAKKHGQSYDISRKLMDLFNEKDRLEKGY